MRPSKRKRRTIAAAITCGLTAAALSGTASPAQATYYYQSTIPSGHVGQPVFVNVRVTADRLGALQETGELKWTALFGDKILDLPNCDPPRTKSFSADGTSAVCSALVRSESALGDSILNGDLGSLLGVFIPTLPRNNVAIILPTHRNYAGNNIGFITSRRRLSDPFPPASGFEYLILP